jgi:diguanylate cyclase (GGDEF)-like protein
MATLPTPQQPAAPPVAQQAQSDLERVERKVEAARAVLVRLLQDLVVAENALSNSQAQRIVEANEHLVVAALHHHEVAETAAMALDEVARAAETDPLTGLPNRTLLLDRFAQAIVAARRRGGRLALLFLDLDDFKRVNDTQGHAAGDAMLQRVAQRLRAAVREADTVSRHGGDEFLVLLSEVARREDAIRIADKLLSALAAPGPAPGWAKGVTASIGISLYPDDGEDVKTLVERADAAMYQAKRQGPGHRACHGEAAVAPRSPAPAPASAHDRVLAEQQRRNAHLQEANESLVLAALGAQELQAAAERAQQRQAELLAAVTAELSDPHAPIRLATAMLGRASSDEPLLPRVQALIAEQVQHMTRLLAAAGAATPAGAGPAQAGEPAEMAAVIEGAVARCRAPFDLRGQRLVLTVGAGPLVVRGDPERLTLLLGNLLDNASKYTPDGGTIRVDAGAQRSELVIAVSDDGIGITPAALPGVFEPFGQDSRAIGFNGVGVGIGLPVVRALVQELGGSVAAESAGHGRGSRFVVRLPLLPGGGADGALAAAT